MNTYEVTFFVKGEITVAIEAEDSERAEERAMEEISYSALVGEGEGFLNDADLELRGNMTNSEREETIRLLELREATVFKGASSALDYDDIAIEISRADDPTT